jgi:hypothetical protein
MKNTPIPKQLLPPVQEIRELVLRARSTAVSEWQYPAGDRSSRSGRRTVEYERKGSKKRNRAEQMIQEVSYPLTKGPGKVLKKKTQSTSTGFTSNTGRPCLKSPRHGREVRSRYGPPPPFARTGATMSIIIPRARRSVNFRFFILIIRLLYVCG